MTPDRLAAVVLAAGRATRFGGPKLLAPLGGRPLLQHVLDALAVIPLGTVVVVLGDDAEEVTAAMRWRSERRVLNPAPERGLSQSLRLGIAELATGPAADPAAEGAYVVLGDQPLLRPGTLTALAEAASDDGPAIVAPRYAGGGGTNPILLGRAAWPLVKGATGDAGLRGMIARDPGLVRWVDVPGSNPDVDTRADLAALAGSEISRGEG